ncbi:hypothetical protein LZ32DRAFT_608014 [Colletotrichum eremochloae]|nr:hypothetical protein LZ32DRAFT_608014 [Colletotrichum eremochloae]
MLAAADPSPPDALTLLSRLLSQAAGSYRDSPHANRLNRKIPNTIHIMPMRLLVSNAPSPRKQTRDSHSTTLPPPVLI